MLNPEPMRTSSVDPELGPISPELALVDPELAAALRRRLIAEAAPAISLAAPPRVSEPEDDAGTVVPFPGPRHPAPAVPPTRVAPPSRERSMLRSAAGLALAFLAGAAAAFGLTEWHGNDEPRVAAPVTVTSVSVSVATPARRVRPTTQRAPIAPPPIVRTTAAAATTAPVSPTTPARRATTRATSRTTTRPQPHVTPPPPATTRAPAPKPRPAQRPKPKPKRPPAPSTAPAGGGFVPARTWSWAPVPQATAYRVTFTRNGAVVFTTRTSAARLVLPRTFRFAKGTYRWSVVPVVGGKQRPATVASRFVVS
jgi:hypothetical protein